MAIRFANNQMELRTLRYFTAVAEELSFTRAANRLHMSQPPLSQQLKALEQELGVKLLSRTPHKVELTEAGALFLKDALHLLALADDAKQRVQNFSSEVIGHLSVGFLGSLTYDFLPQVLRLMRGRYPQVTLSMQEMGIAEQLQALTEGKIQIAFIGPLAPSGSASLASLCVLQDKLVVALPLGHPLSSRRKISLPLLAQQPFVMLSHRGHDDFYAPVLHLCQAANFTPNIVQEADRAQTLLNFVAAGFGISILPSRAQLLPIKDVVYRPLSEPQAVMEQSMVWQANSPSATVCRFIEAVKEVIGRKV